MSFAGRAAVLGLFLMLLAAGSGHAQVQVEIGLRRTLYMLYEPLVCTVTITNRSGRTLDLADQPRDKWFTFQIETTDGRPLPPNNADFRNEPVQLEPGRRLVRSINLTPIYPISEFGTYRVQAAVYVPETGQYYLSDKLNVEITEGREVWKETVGVPMGAGEGKLRKYTILTHRLPQTTMLYLRVQDEESGIIYCTSQLGRYVSFGSPDVFVDDTNNQIHILHNAAPKVFMYSHVDVNGKVLKQMTYRSDATRPSLARAKDGSIVVVGGTPFDMNATPPEKTLPKLSDRPVPLPTPESKPKPEEKRPENLLSR